MANPNADVEGATALPPQTEEERRTETVDDEIKPKEDTEPESKDDGPDVSARLDAIEKELAALKAMMDTLGYAESTVDQAQDDDDTRESIEDLFD
nr:MAG: hypothetical protein [Bacteriophage sp.]